MHSLFSLTHFMLILSLLKKPMKIAHDPFPQLFTFFPNMLRDFVPALLPQKPVFKNTTLCQLEQLSLIYMLYNMHAIKIIAAHLEICEILKLNHYINTVN